MTDNLENPDDVRLRLALWQCQSAPAGVAENLERLDDAAAQAARHAADLLITPEMMVTGYSLAADEAERLADPEDGPIAARVCEIARRYGVGILYGCVERARDGLLYNAIRLVDRTGKPLATHHKTHLFGDLDRAMVAAGSVPPPVVTVAGWRVALLTCYEVEFPELVRSCAVRGADVICVPTANMIEYDVVQVVLLRARALESQVYVAYANYSGAERDLVFGGRSMVVGPAGSVIAEASRTPDMILADTDREVLRGSRETYPYLADRRPELY
ncbi:carbon-nitrogen hydrolase family protein [Gordonia sp. PKS22-38]|uniref:Carbon-nitrogen hydrolase family protein n=1 Tax=Gordonia prachuapensis TaxID=3115651 RepID=A0ABU7MV00_9ACTN|nr:carbon-nitrogen hydrolase family protein [Gordonia sp. PKS22-38]